MAYIAKRHGAHLRHDMDAMTLIAYIEIHYWHQT